MTNREYGSGVSRAVFQYINENQGYFVDQVVGALVDCGFKKTSVSSLISQMVMQNMIKRTKDGCLWPLVNEYRPLRFAKKRRERRPVVRSVVAKEAVPEVLAVPAVPMTSAQLLETMSVKQAHALYLELLAVFGEAK